MKIGLVVLGIILSVATGWAKEEVPSRTQLQAQILQTLDEAEVLRKKMMRQVEKEASEIVKLRDKNAGDDESVHARIVEARTTAKIAEITSVVELAKLEAEKKIHRAIDTYETQKRTTKDPRVLERHRTETMKRIAQAVADIETTKAKATHMIVKLTKEAEIAKATPKRYIDPQAALQIAENDAKARIIKAVSAVETTKTLNRALLCECLSERDREAIRHMDGKKIDLPKIRAKAKAIIAEANAEMEAAKAKAMQKIAQAVATVRIAEYVAGVSEEATRNRGTYPKRIMRYDEKK